YACIVQNDECVITTKSSLAGLAKTLGLNALCLNEKGEQCFLTEAKAPEQADQKEIAALIAQGKATMIPFLTGSDLIGLTYEPLFPYFADTKN
ncbi:hypothetical protein ACSTJQ_26270, partial [Vibrio parahaemolyticus]